MCNFEFVNAKTKLQCFFRFHPAVLHPEEDLGDISPKSSVKSPSFFGTFGGTSSNRYGCQNNTTSHQFVTKFMHSTRHLHV